MYKTACTYIKMNIENSNEITYKVAKTKQLKQKPQWSW